MGWLFQNDKLRHQTPVEHITQRFTHDGETSSAIVIAAAAVRGTIYAAIRNHDKQTGETYVFCAVILFKNNERGFGHKAMDESMGPCEADCPDRIMRLLSPVADMPSPGEAAEWRARVAAVKTKRALGRATIEKLSPGDVIRLPCPVKVRSVSTDRFTLVEYRKRTPIFAPVTHPALLCRLRAATLAGAAVER